MDATMSAVNDFLKKYGMFPGDIDPEAICADFESEMDRGLSSYQSGGSLMMLPTFIKIEDTIPVAEPVIVIDAGGTNLRTALVHFDRDLNCAIEEFRNHPMPGANGAISKEAFFETLYEYLEPLLDRSDRIGFCFSYPTAIMPNRDGKVLAMSKEIRVDGLIGEPVNQNVHDAIRAHRPSARKSIIQINDTAATLLGGKAAYPGRFFESYIGLILGTGTNTCYIENCANVKKLGEVEMTPEQTAAYGPGNSMLINVESGNFNKAPRSAFDISLDEKTKDPGRYMFEKAMSGGYQGLLLTEVLHKAAADGLFSAEACARFAAIEGLEARDIDTFLFFPYGDNVLAAAVGANAFAANANIGGAAA
ncbi:MAG: hexokinase, partial [Clostridiales bacterium]|nr:hexokinase [Clostridiales bacterium]